MWALAPGSVHMRTFAQPPINTSAVSAKSPSNIAPNSIVQGEGGSLYFCEKGANAKSQNFQKSPLNLILGELGSQAKLYDPRTTPSGRKLWEPERKKEKTNNPKKIVDTTSPL